MVPVEKSVLYIDSPIKMIQVPVHACRLHSMLSWNQRQRIVYLWLVNGRNLQMHPMTWLMASALNLNNLRFKQLELNAQIVRFPSGLETEFAGQALYLLRIYGLTEDQDTLELVETPLENTPDVQGLNKDSSLKESFVEWTNSNISAIDNGTHLIPERFLATEAISYSTLGIHRRANKPFDALFDEKTLSKIQMPTGKLPNG